LTRLILAAKPASKKVAKPRPSLLTDVEAFLAALDHPFKDGILRVRKIFLAADPRIAKGIKWNAPSFRTSEYFATFHLLRDVKDISTNQSALADIVRQWIKHV
jgi:hypothetical protein